MSKTIAKLATAALIAIAVPLYAGVASAAPVSGALAIKNAATSNIENVRYYGWRGGGYGWRGGGWGWGGVGAGLAAGAIIGGVLAAPYYYGGGPYYAYGGGPYYAYGGGPYYAPAPGYYAQPYGGDDAVAYCMQRYRSYDPRSGTFLGNDGYRHPCP
ncbi:MAG TPA: BA14K family protein [Pseudolabrys sp.]|nr:BA14K family protein [Pseudolabrys sp.]